MVLPLFKSLLEETTKDTNKEVTKSSWVNILLPTREDGIDELTYKCHSLSASAGWWNDCKDVPDRYVVPTKIALIHSEISEAMEGYRKDKMDDHLPHRPSIEVELADAIIRICDLAGYLELDLGGALVEKVEYNQDREDHKLENRNKEGGKKF